MPDVTSKHVVMIMMLSTAILGLFLWNRTCILSAEISNLEHVLRECATSTTKVPQTEVCTPPLPAPVKPAKKPQEKEASLEVVYGGRASKEALTKAQEQK